MGVIACDLPKTQGVLVRSRCEHELLTEVIPVPLIITSPRAFDGVNTSKEME